MNKADLVNEMAARTGFQKNETKRIINTLMDVLKGALENREKIQLVGFGSFEVVKRAARVGQNPQNGQTIHIPAKNVVKFKPSKKMDMPA